MGIKLEPIDRSKLNWEDQLAYDAWVKTDYAVGFTMWKTAYKMGLWNSLVPEMKALLEKVIGFNKRDTHCIVVCDTFDWEDYPVYVKVGEDVREREKEYKDKNMQKVMEVYNLKMDLDMQLNQQRSFNY